MATSFARVNQGGLPYRISGAQKVTVTDMTCDDDYITGGYPVTAANLGLNAIHSGDASVSVAGTGTPNLANAAVLAQTDGSALVYLSDEIPDEQASSADNTGTILRITARRN